MMEKKPYRGIFYGLVAFFCLSASLMVYGFALITTNLTAFQENPIQTSSSDISPSPHGFPSHISRLSPTLTPFQPVTNTPSPIPSPTLTPTPTFTPTSTPSFLRWYADQLGLWLGTTFQPKAFNDPEYFRLFGSEFNTLMLPINLNTFYILTNPPDMTLDEVLDTTFFEQGLNFAASNRMHIVAGPLVYRNDTAPALLYFDSPDCGGWTRNALVQKMRKYIFEVMHIGVNKVTMWKVVNEPLRESYCWQKIIGKGYVAFAFQYAHQADPNALLMLNESFGTAGVERSKVNKMISLIQFVRSKGAPVDVLGVEMHLDLRYLRSSYLDEFRYLLSQAQEIGVYVLISEMDVYQGPPGYLDNPFEVQARVYRSVLSTCLEFPNCKGIITWGISDRHSWLRTRSINPLLDARPLLFDDDYQPKPAYFSLLETLASYLGH